MEEGKKGGGAGLNEPKYAPVWLVRNEETGFASHEVEHSGEADVDLINRLPKHLFGVKTRLSQMF